LWATWPALALRALTIPAFECLAIAFACGWLVLARLERASGRDASDKHWAVEWVPALACALGLTGSNAFHIFATHYIPAAEANLISYLWPVEIIALGAVLKLFMLRARHVVGLCLGFAGTIVLMSDGGLSLSATGIVGGVLRLSPDVERSRLASASARLRHLCSSVRGAALCG
jgi:drug/metabolite transporter (DMT)-like permease